MRYNLQGGKDLLETISKILLIIVFAVMITGLFIPRGEGLPLMFGGVMLFFFFPIIEAFLILYHKWLYRNIVVGEGYLDEEPDLWERFKIRIIKVIPFKELTQVHHDAYMLNIESYYKEQVRDKSLDEVDKRFKINEKTLEVEKIKEIDYKKLLENESKQKPKSSEYKNEDEEIND